MSEETKTTAADEGLTPKAKEPDHGQDPRRVPGTPQAAEAEAMGDPEADEAPIGFVDLQMRRKVNRMKSRGLRLRMGPDFPGCAIRIRPWTARPIQIAREKWEVELRGMYPKVKQGDDLPPEATIELNRRTSVMSIMGMTGTFLPEKGAKLVTFEDDRDYEDIKAVRRFISTYLLMPYDPKNPETGEAADMDFLEILIEKNKELSRITYQEIDRLGEDCVYGAIEHIDYGDSKR